MGMRKRDSHFFSFARCEEETAPLFPSRYSPSVR